jgi:non-specific protein-tyrosine kinase
VPVTDAAVLAPRLDGVLLVLKAGKSKLERGQRAKALLEQVHATLLGVVLMNARDAMGPHTFYPDQRPSPA